MVSATTASSGNEEEDANGNSDWVQMLLLLRLLVGQVSNFFSASLRTDMSLFAVLMTMTTSKWSQLSRDVLY